MSQSLENDPIYFWREFEHPYGYLSQWYAASFSAPSPIPSEPSRTFATTEEYMMYHKAMLFGDKEIADQIVLATTPKQQQALGRKVKSFTAEKWQANKERIVEAGNWYKFTNQTSDADLGKKLLETGERPLVEVSRSHRSVCKCITHFGQASPYDRIWGVGFDADNASKNKDQWGENLLGKALVRVRTRLRERREATVQHE